MKNELEIFSNKEFGQVRVISIQNEPYFVAKDLITNLGYQKAYSDVLKQQCDEDDYVLCDKTHPLTGVEFNYKELGQRGGYFVNESAMYSLILGSELKNAKKFKRWVTSEILPTIRKTGGYVNNDNLFIDTYLPFADENTKLLFSTTLETVRKQNELIKKQQEEILHKQEVINGLTDDVDIYKKRVIINRICKRRHGNYANRYKELYKCFRETFHADLEARCEGHNLKQIKKKDKLSTIAYAEKFGFIDDLYSCCVKLYETEVKEIIEELNSVQE